jgi:nicotinate phosphoribosyltransferase
MATNAARYRIVSGATVKLLEFGLRRAQGPDGGLSASKYAYIGESSSSQSSSIATLANFPLISMAALWIYYLWV